MSIRTRCPECGKEYVKGRLVARPPPGPGAADLIAAIDAGKVKPLLPPGR